MLTQEEFHQLIKNKQFILSVNKIKYEFHNDKVLKEEKELASYEVRVTEKGYFLDMKPFIYDSDDIILIPKNYDGYCILLNPKTNEPFRRFITLQEV